MIGRRGETAEAGQERRSHIGAEGPGQGRVDIIVVVAPIDPSQGLGIPVGRVTRGRAEFLDHHRVGRRGAGHQGIPSPGGHPLIVVDVGGIKDAVPGARIRHGIASEPRQVVRPAQAPHDDHVVRAGAPDRRHEPLHPRGVVGRLGRVGVGHHGAATLPGGPEGAVGPVGAEGLVEQVEEHRGVVAVDRGDRGPKGHGVPVRHGGLARTGGASAGRSAPAPARTGTRGGGAVVSAGPMEVQVDINVVGGTIVDDRLHHAPVGRGVDRRVSVVLVAASEPVVLVHGEPNHIAMPGLDGSGDDRDVIRHVDAADRGGGGPGAAVARWGILQARDVYPTQADGAAPAGRGDGVTDDLELGRSGQQEGWMNAKQQQKERGDAPHPRDFKIGICRVPHGLIPSSKGSRGCC